MERVIKFRVWDKKNKLFVFSSDIVRPFSLGNKYEKGNQNLVISLEGQVLQANQGFSPSELRKNYIIQQFTGLFDKNNKEIYEGDIIEYFIGQRSGGEWVSTKCQVVYPESFSAWYLMDKWNNLETLDSIGADVVKIIGNIFENPELMK